MTLDHTLAEIADNLDRIAELRPNRGDTAGIAGGPRSLDRTLAEIADNLDRIAELRPNRGDTAGIAGGLTSFDDSCRRIAAELGLGYDPGPSADE